MAAAARLQRLQKHLQSDLAVLPRRPLFPKSGAALCHEPLSDDVASGGVPLQDSDCKQAKDVPSTATTAVTTKPSTDQPIPSEETAVKENIERRFIWIPGAASSYNLGTATKLSALPAAPLPPTLLKKGELAPTKYFTPIVALSKYPYKFCNKTCMQTIASTFFDEGKFWTREWDLYYIWDLDESAFLLLVSEAQFEDLLKEINSELTLDLRITNQQREDGLVSRFLDHPRCHPRYLGRSRSRDEYDTMAHNVPSANFKLPGEPVPPNPDGSTLEEFKQMIEDLRDLQKAKSKAAKEKKKLERVAKQRGLTDQFKRAQRYLGLRPTMQGEEQTASHLPPSVDSSLPTPFPCDRSVVFVCVDVESFEKAHHKITEIGIATLDTRDLAGIPSGSDGENWRSKIRARHFRIQEHAHLVNSQFVRGCPERFDFGRSEWISLRDAQAGVASCFRAPFAIRPDQVPDEQDILLDGMDLNEQRNLIFLGHNALTDVKYLQQIGFDPLTLPNLLESQDTAAMYRVWRREQQSTSLGNILYDFHIAGFNLHNAGNDAVFTVQAMLAICVREASIRGTSQMKAKRDEEKSTKIAAALDEAKRVAEDEAEGWSDHDANGDGGAPIPIKLKGMSKPSTTDLAHQSVTANAPDPASGGEWRRRRGNRTERGRSRDVHQQGGFQNDDTHGGNANRGVYRDRRRSETHQHGRGCQGGRGRSAASGADSQETHFW